MSSTRTTGMGTRLTKVVPGNDPPAASRRSVHSKTPTRLPAKSTFDDDSDTSDLQVKFTQTPHRPQQFKRPTTTSKQLTKPINNDSSTSDQSDDTDLFPLPTQKKQEQIGKKSSLSTTPTTTSSPPSTVSGFTSFWIIIALLLNLLLLGYYLLYINTNHFPPPQQQDQSSLPSSSSSSTTTPTLFPQPLNNPLQFQRNLSLQTFPSIINSMSKINSNEFIPQNIIDILSTPQQHEEFITHPFSFFLLDPNIIQQSSNNNDNIIPTTIIPQSTFLQYSKTIQTILQDSSLPTTLQLITLFNKYNSQPDIQTQLLEALGYNNRLLQHHYQHLARSFSQLLLQHTQLQSTQSHITQQLDQCQKELLNIPQCDKICQPIQDQKDMIQKQYDTLSTTHSTLQQQHQEISNELLNCQKLHQSDTTRITQLETELSTRQAELLSCQSTIQEQQHDKTKQVQEDEQANIKMIGQLQQQLKECQSKQNGINDQFEEYKQISTKDISQLKQLHQDQITELNKSNQIEMDKLNQSCQTDIDELTQSHTIEIKKLQDSITTLTKAVSSSSCPEIPPCPEQQQCQQCPKQQECQQCQQCPEIPPPQQCPEFNTEFAHLLTTIGSLEKSIILITTELEESKSSTQNLTRTIELTTSSKSNENEYDKFYLDTLIYRSKLAASPDPFLRVLISTKYILSTALLPPSLASVFDETVITEPQLDHQQQQQQQQPQPNITTTILRCIIRMIPFSVLTIIVFISFIVFQLILPTVGVSKFFVLVLWLGLSAWVTLHHMYVLGICLFSFATIAFLSFFFPQFALNIKQNKYNYTIY